MGYLVLAGVLVLVLVAAVAILFARKNPKKVEAAANAPGDVTAAARQVGQVVKDLGERLKR